MAPSSEALPLAGLRVLDLTTGVAGAYATKLFVDAGADVLMGEPAGGHPLRSWVASRAAIPAGEDGALFRYLAASKRSIEIDLATPRGRAESGELAATVDLIFEDAEPAAAAPHALGPDAVRASPAVSVVSISAFGCDGPWAQRPATEFTLQASTGSIAYRGLRDRAPVAAGGRLGDWIAGSFAAVGGLLAWWSGRQTGRGQHVDLSTFEAVLLCMTVYHDLASQWFEGPLPRAIEIPSIEPARDGWVGFCTITGQQWKDFCLMIGRPEVGEDERFYDGRARMEALPFMQEIIHGWTRERSVEEIIEAASLLRIPVAPLGDGRSLPGLDHFVERGVFVDNPHGFVQPRPPYRLHGGASARPVGSAPGLDEHRAAVLAQPPTRRETRARESGDAAPPLAGLRVIDLSAFWAGPFATALLADMGADVVKIESIQRPDGMRFAGAVRNDRMWEWSPVFHGANPGKRAITLKLDSEEGRALLRRLVETADVVVENYSPRVFENFGLGWETIHAWNPRTVMLRMPAFGLDGPWRDRAGFAMTVEQVSGLAQVTGYRDHPLVIRGACDPVGGLHGVFALLLALRTRERNGEGTLVELPLVETALNIAAEQVIEYSAYARLLERDENRGPAAAPQGVYACGDAPKMVAIAVATDEQWRALVSVLDDSGARPSGWARSPALAGAAGRREHHDLVDRYLGAWLAERHSARVESALLAAGIPAARLANAHFVHPNPQLDHRGFFQTLSHPYTGETRYPGLPMRFSGLRRDLHRAPAPTLGQHNDEILAGELGLSEAELADLRERGIVGERPSFM